MADMEDMNTHPDPTTYTPQASCGAGPSPYPCDHRRLWDGAIVCIEHMTLVDCSTVHDDRNEEK